jgi:hypothetical protein
MIEARNTLATTNAVSGLIKGAIPRIIQELPISTLVF